jgi:hypothetical protein
MIVATHGNSAAICLEDGLARRKEAGQKEYYSPYDEANTYDLHDYIAPLPRSCLMLIL